MKPLVLLGALLVSGFVGCGTPPPPTSPADEPGLPEPEAAEPEAAEPEATEPEATEPEAAEPEAAEPEATPAPAEPSGRPTCEELKKSRCKVTQGCAWREGAGKAECIPTGSDD